MLRKMALIDGFGSGGARRGAGRPKGARNKKTEALQLALAATGTTPLEYILSVMRDPDIDKKERLTAAIAAAPYVHAKLSSVEMNATISMHEEALKELE